MEEYHPDERHTILRDTLSPTDRRERGTWRSLNPTAAPGFCGGKDPLWAASEEYARRAPYLNPPILATKQPVWYSTHKGAFNTMSLETFTSTNRQLVASLAKQGLPKCQPNVCDRDVAIFRKLKKQAQMTTAKATLTQNERRRPRWTFLQQRIRGRYLQRKLFLPSWRTSWMQPAWNGSISF